MRPSHDSSLKYDEIASFGASCSLLKNKVAVVLKKDEKPFAHVTSKETDYLDGRMSYSFKVENLSKAPVHFTNLKNEENTIFVLETLLKQSAEMLGVDVSKETFVQFHPTLAAEEENLSLATLFSTAGEYISKECKAAHPIKSFHQLRQEHQLEVQNENWEKDHENALHYRN